VTVVHGSGAGLSGPGSQLFTQAGSAPETDDQFGAALAGGDFNNDGFADLAAGAPFESVGNIVGAGAVSVLYGSAGRLTTTGGQLFTQDTAGIAGVAEAEDHFGAALATGDANPPPAPASPSTTNPKLRKARSR
jgi:FG-GAP repeat protein